MKTIKFMAFAVIAFGSMICAKGLTTGLNPFDKSREAEEGLAKIDLTLPDSEIRIYAQCQPGNILAIAQKKGNTTKFSSITCDSFSKADWK